MRISRDQVDAPTAVRCTVGVLIPLVIGLAAGSVADGVAGAVGALCGGFASFQGTYRSRAGIVLAVGAGMAISTVTGALAEGSVPATAGVDAAWGALAGMMAAFGPAALLVGMQWTVGALIAAALPMNGGQALVRGALICAGAAIQMLLVVVVWPLRSYPAERRSVAAVYDAISDYASDIQAGALLSRGGATRIDEARAVLRDPQPFGRAQQIMAFQALLDEGERIRINLVRVARLQTLLPVDAVRAALGRLITAVAQHAGDTAEAIRSDGLPIAEPDLLPHIAEVDNATAGLEPAWAAEELRESVRALGGQLRSAARMPSGRHLARATRRRREALTTVRANLTWESSTFRHALRLAVTLALCVVVARLGDVARGYWVGMTALVVLRPDFVTTATRGAGRILGTLAGSVVATALVAWLRPGTEVLAVLFGLAVLLAYLLLRANYALFSVCITGYVVFLLSFAKLPAFTTVSDRVVDTLLGGGIAIAVCLAWPTWESRLVGDQLARLLEAQRAYVAGVLAVHRDPTDGRRSALESLRAGARLARSNTEASVDRLALEPERARRSGLETETARGVLAAARRLSLAALSLQAHLPAETDPPQPALAALSEAVPAQLGELAQALQLGERPAPPPEPLRELHDSLRAGITAPAREGSVPADLVLSEADLLVDSVNTIRELLSR